MSLRNTLLNSSLLADKLKASIRAAHRKDFVLSLSRRVPIHRKYWVLNIHDFGQRFGLNVPLLNSHIVRNTEAFA